MSKPHCPNCGHEAEGTPSRIECAECDAIFKVSRSGARVETVGKIADLDQRVSALEGLVGSQVEPEPKDQPAAEPEDSEPETPPADEDQQTESDEGDLW